MFFLAGELGMTVKQLGRSMDSAELSEWMAYYRIEAEDRRKAMMAAQANRGLATTKARRRR